MPSPSSRYWCFTHYSDISQNLPQDAKYCVYQPELAPTTKRKHYQGYIEFSTAVKGGQNSEWVKQFIPGAHIEPKSTFATREEAEHYCRKPCSADCPNKHCKEAREKGNGRIDWRNTKPIVIGVQEEQGDIKKRVTQGSRTDLAKALKDIQSGKSVLDIIEEQPSMLYHIRSLKEMIREYRFQPKHRDIKVIVLWGNSRTGKSYTARQQDHPVFNKSDGDWWDGYNGEKTIILDDYYGTLKYQELLKVLDPYPYQVPIKGSFVWAQYETVYITSNSPPDKWYKHGYTEALHNRLTEIKKYIKKPDGSVEIVDDKPRLDKLQIVDSAEQFTTVAIKESPQEYNEWLEQESSKLFTASRNRIGYKVYEHKPEEEEEPPVEDDNYKLYIQDGKWVLLDKPPKRESKIPDVPHRDNDKHYERHIKSLYNPK